jgi:hypothetical protein
MLLCPTLLLLSCAAPTYPDPDAPSKDHAVASGTDASDAVRDRATAVALAAKFCGANPDKHWRAELVGQAWSVTQAVVRGKYEETSGACANIDKSTGALTTPCRECVTVY